MLTIAVLCRWEDGPYMFPLCSDTVLYSGKCCFLSICCVPNAILKALYNEPILSFTVSSWDLYGYNHLFLDKETDLPRLGLTQVNWKPVFSAAISSPEHFNSSVPLLHSLFAEQFSIMAWCLLLLPDKSFHWKHSLTGDMISCWGKRFTQAGWILHDRDSV